MAGFVLMGALAAFGLICVIWICCGFFLTGSRSGGAVLTGPMTEGTLTTARRWIWLREMGLMPSPLIAVKDRFSETEQEWLSCHGFLLCSSAETTRRLGIGENQIDTGFGDPSGCHQRRGISEL